jgi:hypothetical protein
MSVVTLPPTGASARRTTSVRPQARPRPRPKFGPVGRGAHPDVGVRPRTSAVRLTARGLALAWVAAIVAVGLIVFGLVHALAPAQPATTGLRTITVESGQTAWDIARSVNPAVDPRVTVTEIKQLNGLGSAGVLPDGQELVVPVFASGS